MLLWSRRSFSLVGGPDFHFRCGLYSLVHVVPKSNDLKTHFLQILQSTLDSFGIFRFSYEQFPQRIEFGLDFSGIFALLSIAKMEECCFTFHNDRMCLL